MFEKYKKNPVKFTIQRLLFSSAVKNDTEKIFITPRGFRYIIEKIKTIEPTCPHII